MAILSDDKDIHKEADVCLFLEGTYPYVSGGVSSWTHELIETQSHLTFHLVTLSPSGAKLVPKYKLPKNVVSKTDITLQALPPGKKILRKKDMEFIFESLEPLCLRLHENAYLRHYKKIIEIISPYRKKLGSHILLDSYASWNMLSDMYTHLMPNGCFLDYFWSWRSLMGGLYSVVLADMPKAKCYHSLCTGFAGLFLARARIEEQKPCVLTEHGIYTNERRIEIASAEWLDDANAQNLTIREHGVSLRDFWINTFTSYSRICYEACTHIATLYEGNRIAQIADGAPADMVRIIPNGVDYDHYSQIEHKRDPKKRQTVALIGRVVAIKDVKTFIRAIDHITKTLPNIDVLIMGPQEEDPEYFQECLDLIDMLGLKKTVKFTGKVMIEKYLPKIDVVVLSSISEAQPLVLLEVGAVGIPCVATNVGSCKEILLGRSNELPELGPGGVVTGLSNPKQIAEGILKLLLDRAFYDRCSKALKERVRTQYNKKDQHDSYKKLYETMFKYKVEPV